MEQVVFTAEEVLDYSNTKPPELPEHDWGSHRLPKVDPGEDPESNEKDRHIFLRTVFPQHGQGVDCNHGFRDHHYQALFGQGGLELPAIIGIKKDTEM